jgi:hypothetical protein
VLHAVQVIHWAQMRAMASALALMSVDCGEADGNAATR